MSAYEITDPDGETISIRNLKLVLMECEPSEYDHEAIDTIKLNACKAQTFNQRALPFVVKCKVLWRFFGELFLDRIFMNSSDPYIIVALNWQRKQQTRPTFKNRLVIYRNLIRDLFIWTPAAENLEGVLPAEYFKRC